MAAPAPGGAAAAGNDGLTDPNVIIKRFQMLQGECQQLVAKLQELEIDLAEHELVANQLKLLDGGRKAFRLVGGVLMERTVGDVLPELTSTAEMLKVAVKQCGEALEKKQRETAEWKDKYKIRAQTAQEIQQQQQRAQQQARAEEGGGTSGVLA